MWETDGVLYHHIIKVYSLRHVFVIPTSQIVNRWSKGLKGGYPRSNPSVSRMPCVTEMEFMNKAIMEIYDIGGMVVGNEVAENLIGERVKALRGEACALSATDDR